MSVCETAFPDELFGQDGYRIVALTCWVRGRYSRPPNCVIPSYGSMSLLKGEVSPCPLRARSDAPPFGGVEDNHL